MGKRSFGYRGGQTKRIQRLRPKLAERQGWKCYWCKTKIKIYRDNQVYHPDEATVTYLVKRCDGGTDAEENTVISCRICGQIRSGSLPPARFRHLTVPVAFQNDPAWFQGDDRRTEPV